MMSTSSNSIIILSDDECIDLTNDISESCSSTTFKKFTNENSNHVYKSSTSSEDDTFPSLPRFYKQKILSKSKENHSLKRYKSCPDQGVNQTSVPKRKQIVLLDEAFRQLFENDTNFAEQILKYEPLSLNIVQQSLRNYGNRCSKKELKQFLDTKCILYKGERNH